MNLNRFSDEQLATKCAKGLDKRATEALIARYRRVCIMEAKDAPMRLYDLEDRVQECTLALYRAIVNWDPTQGIKFATYAKRLMRNALIDLARKEGRRVEDVNIESLDGEITIEDVFAGRDDVEEEASAALLIERIRTTLADVAGGKARDTAAAICSALDPSGYDKFFGQFSLFEAYGEADIEQMATSLQDFCLRVVELRSEGNSLREVADITGRPMDACENAIRLLVLLLADKVEGSEKIALGRKGKSEDGSLFVA